MTEYNKKIRSHLCDMIDGLKQSDNLYLFHQQIVMKNVL